MTLRSKAVATYTIKDQEVTVQLCWKGENPLEDEDRFYDFYNKEGDVLNLGSPYHDDGDGTPTQELVAEFLYPEDFVMVAGQECPLCQCGTIEETATEYKCCGECGNIWDKPESTPQTILIPSHDGNEYAWCVTPPVDWDGDMDAVNTLLREATEKANEDHGDQWEVTDLQSYMEAKGFRLTTLHIAHAWD
jgi:hypothetical protein